jgi:hypothetical protein
LGTEEGRGSLHRGEREAAQEQMIGLRVRHLPESGPGNVV